MATSIPYDPVASALEAVRAHIKAHIPGAVSVRGPEEFPESYSGGVVFSVVELSRGWAAMMTPAEVDRTDLGPTAARVVWRVAQLEIAAQVTLWADYRFIQDILAGAVESGGAVGTSMWHNRLPWKVGLELASEEYHGRPLTIEAGGGIAQRDPDDVVEGMWRRTWDLDILTDLVATSLSIPVAEEIVLLLSTELGSDIVTEPDFEVTAP